ncbi:MAG: antibiotic biosynthesis monooxygenase [Bacteroidota bacterium]|nr:antibiotic biosynthesis monooxygenase [Bacteroidota bacterium]
MIVRIVRLTLSKEYVDAFEALFRTHQSAIASQPGCMGVEMLSDPKNDCIRGTLSRWKSEEDLNAYRASSLFGEVWPLTKSLFAGKPEVWSYEVIERR